MEVTLWKKAEMEREKHGKRRLVITFFEPEKQNITLLLILFFILMNFVEQKLEFNYCWKGIPITFGSCFY